MRRSLLLGVIVAAALGGVVVLLWWVWRDQPPRRSVAANRGVRARPGLDVETYRRAYRLRVERARRVMARHAASRAAGADDAGVASGGTLVSPMAMRLIEPQCILGPAELCELLRDAVVDCAAGDGAACLAVGQYLVDTPPRPLIAMSYFHYACRAGEQEACERVKTARQAPDGECADDVFRCAWWGYRERDAGLLDESCALGVADACVTMIDLYEDDPVRARTYLEIACQLGNPMTCQELARRLRPGCQPGAEGPCYPPEPEEAEDADLIACEAGFC
jgi:TPR repeat protein